MGVDIGSTVDIMISDPRRRPIELLIVLGTVVADAMVSVVMQEIGLYALVVAT